MEYIEAWKNTPQTREAFHNLLRSKASPYFSRYAGVGAGLAQVKDFIVPNLPPPDQLDAIVAGQINSLAQRRRRSRRSKRKRRKSRKSRRRPRF